MGIITSRHDMFNYVKECNHCLENIVEECYKMNRALKMMNNWDKIAPVYDSILRKIERVLESEIPALSDAKKEIKFL